MSTSSTAASSSTPPATDPAIAQDDPHTPTRACAKCAKPETGDEETGFVLKPCITCKSVDYCSRDCKKADTKAHKKVCAGLAQAYAQTAPVKMASRAPPKGGNRGGGLGKWQFDT